MTQLREVSRKPGIELLVDLSGVEQVYASGALLLKAELHRASCDGANDYVLQGKRARNERTDQVFKQVGIYDLLNVQCPIEPNDETVRYWRHATGVASDGEKGGTILMEYEGQLAEGLTKGLYDGLVEAMTNTVQHAYLKEEGGILQRGIGRRWWMLSQEKDDNLTVCICDLGIGIPRSLPKSPTYSLPEIIGMFRSMSLERTDFNAIKVAVQLGRTRTGQQGRGKGLSEIIEAVNLSETGVVFISSNRGVFTASAGEAKGADTPWSTRGTLIHWQVPMVKGEAILGRDGSGDGE